MQTHTKPALRQLREIDDEELSLVLHAIAEALLGEKPDHIFAAGNGGNSRIYRVETGEDRYALKMYPVIKNDRRDRLGVEKQALQFMERGGITCVPRWIGDRSNYGLLTWVEGELANPPTLGDMDAAVAFIGDIRRLSALPAARMLPAASETCISGAEIVRQIQRRLAALQEAALSEAMLADFLANDFIPLFTGCSSSAHFHDAQPQDLCLIPADFGFHNAMRGEDGIITFIDFEYFGWDDPVKLTADFLLHPAMRLEEAQSRRFREAMLALFSGDPAFSARLAAHMPLFALRWTLILLNEFLPERWSGRAFAQGTGEWEVAKTRQLAKAADMLKHATKEYHA